MAIERLNLTFLVPLAVGVLLAVLSVTRLITYLLVHHPQPVWGFFTGLMGINVGGMPGVEDARAFWVIVGLCLGITGLAALLLRLKRWL